MKSLLTFSVLLFIVLGTSVNGYSQEIEIRKSNYFYIGQRLMPKDLLHIMRNNQDAIAEMQIAKRNYDWGQVLGGIGGGLIGWPLGTAIGGGDPNWMLAVIGAGVVIASIPLFTAYTKRSRNAVDLYNQSLLNSSQNPVQFNFGTTSNGIGITIQW